MNPSSNSSDASPEDTCNTHMEFTTITSVFMVRFLLLVPLSTFVVFLGWRQWSAQRSFRSCSHSDIFTFNVATLELICGPGTILYVLGWYYKVRLWTRLGIFVFIFTFKGEAFFHILTCVERYLAVVHPVSYMRLRNHRGVRIRNICVVSAWILGLGWSSLLILRKTLDISISLLSLSTTSMLIVSFCSVSVLRVLVRPGPGDGGGTREAGAQMKRRAFYTITAVLVVLFLWFSGFLVSNTLAFSVLLRGGLGCLILVSGLWFNLPSSLVLPLLYLHRTGALSSGLRGIRPVRGKTQAAQ